MLCDANLTSALRNVQLTSMLCDANLLVSVMCISHQGSAMCISHQLSAMRISHQRSDARLASTFRCASRINAQWLHLQNTRTSGSAEHYASSNTRQHLRQPRQSLAITPSAPSAPAASFRISARFCCRGNPQSPLWRGKLQHHPAAKAGPHGNIAQWYLQSVAPRQA